jgi:U32 family peptidase
LFNIKKQIFYCDTHIIKQGVKRLEEALIEIGSVTHVFSTINVAIIELTLPLSVGDRILVKGPLTDFSQTVDSMQIDRKDIQRAEGGKSVGLKLVQMAKEKDVVYKKL